MKKLIVHFSTIFLLVILCSCSKGSVPSNIPSIYGAELYNSSYVVITKTDEYRHIIPIMSKINLSSITDLQLETSGGTYNFRYEIETRDYVLDGYKWYNVILYFSNIEFQDSVITIDKIQLYTDETNKIVLVPDKCQFVSFSGEYNVEKININNSPLRMPEDMKTFPLKISADENIKVTGITITNSDFFVENYSCDTYSESTDFLPITIGIDSGMQNIEINFSINSSQLEAYKNFGTTIIVSYEYNGKMYYTVPGVSTTIYNPFDPDYGTIEKYYNEVIKKISK
ncbi:MAG: hypothetical protein LBI03_11505 [Clostridiales bacterium]|nr:hypothetical protein [Clostridiales bacterium]